MAAVAAAAVLAGCASVGTGEFACEDGTIVTAERRPAVSAVLEEEEEPFIEWSARGGVVPYSGMWPSWRTVRARSGPRPPAATPSPPPPAKPPA